MGHPVLRQRARPIRTVRPPRSDDAEAHRRHDRHHARVPRRRAGGAAGARGRAAVRRRCSTTIRTATASEVVVVNPEIVPVSDTKAEGWEGCLSIPDIRGMVPRYTDIVVRALDRTGKTIELTLKDFPARVAQHETDHLDGVLFFDRMTSMQSLTYLDEYSRYHAKGEDDDRQGLVAGAPTIDAGAPVVTLRTAPTVPFDGAIAAARTCYSPRVIGTSEVTDEPARHDRRAHLRRRSPHRLPARALRVRAREHLAPVRLDVPALLSVLQLRAVEPALRQAERAARVRAADHGRGARRLRAGGADARGTATPSSRRCSRTTRSRSSRSCATSGRRTNPERLKQIEKDAEKRAIETARYVIPIGAFTSMVHTVSGIVLHRLQRMMHTGDAPLRDAARHRRDGAAGQGVGSALLREGRRSASIDAGRRARGDVPAGRAAAATATPRSSTRG